MAQESYSMKLLENSKRTWLKFSGSDFGLYILIIEYVHVYIESTDTICIRNNPEPWGVGIVIKEAVHRMEA